MAASRNHETENPAGKDVQASNAAESPSAEAVQKLVDECAGFNLFVIPDRTGRNDRSAGEAGAFPGTHTLKRFDVALQTPTERGVLSSNTFGETVGSLDIQWFMMPDSFVARPDRQPPTTQLDPTVTQRFAMQETTFRFGQGDDGFKCFGTGRTFPTLIGDHPRVVIGAIATVLEGFGKFKGLSGNLTLCGDLGPQGFQGNILVRFQDPQSQLRDQRVLPPIQAHSDLDPEVTYFLWAGQKGAEQPGLQNHFSFGPDGQVRGMNITTQQRTLDLDFAAPEDFRTNSFSIGKSVVGLEIGFGRLSVPDANPVGTQLNPTLFEGVARYSFIDSRGTTVGTVLTSLIEGRRFDMPLPGVPVPGLRFGFFGPIVAGTGCFAGAEGIFYGASGSVFNPPPGDHIVTHFYMMRLHDPAGRFRAPRRR